MLEERRVLLARPRRPAVVAEIHLDARLAQPRDALAVDARVRVAERDHDPRHPRRDDRVGARRREPLSQLEQGLGALFLRVHRNCLVARRLIRGVEQQNAVPGGDNAEAHWGVLLEGHAEPIAVSRRQWPAVKTLLKGRI